MDALGEGFDPIALVQDSEWWLKDTNPQKRRSF
jgi:hypothetical protein